MNNKESYDRILYIEKNKSIFVAIIALVISGVIGIFSKDFPDISGHFYSIIYLVSCFIVILLITSILKVEKNGYYKFIRIIYYCIVIYNVKFLLPEISEPSSFIIIQYKGAATVSILMNVIVLVFLKITRGINNKGVKNNIMYVLFFSLLIINHIVLMQGKEAGIAVFINIINLFLIVIIRLNLKGYSIIKGKKINILLFILLMLSLVSCLDIIYIILPRKILMVEIIIEIITFIGFCIYTIFTLEKLLNSPYKGLFNNLYNQNLNMNKINNEIEKKNMELEFSQVLIRKKERMFKNFFTNIPMPLAIVSSNERILFTNSSFKDLIDKKMIKSIINRKIFSLISVEDNIMEDANSQVKIISGQVIINNEIKYIDMEFMEISENKDDILIIFNDVTSKVKINKLKTQMENTSFQEKIKRDFLSNISHDLKTPINVIYSAAQLIDVYIKGNKIDQLNKYIVISKLNCMTLITLTNNLIDNSRIYSDYLSVNLQNENIVRIVEETVTSLVDYAKSKKINLIFDTDNEEIYLNIDEDFIKRIVINIISNSIKFSKENGEISVLITTLAEEVLIKFKDNGVGMDEEFTKTAFSRYSMSNKNKNLNKTGTGIGLFVVKNLVEKQGGNISIKSKIDKGTEIEVKFKKGLLDEH
ncbi:sensor histidine kinase [Clostridium vincentii]|uniref:histidine kinase n=1 Tax=Clostridium vincentii TaxID=52704 RepID=A0A2T0BHS8_9CLOT|nr:HAMP domain-containing sensor histidine kinase [Clostridium vincentii]PRR83435.1 Alkaline phosphatase synthesis sensor protein PhoR [Clostridium vincentii]